MPLNSMLERLGSWNSRMNGLPRKGMLVATTMLLTWLTVVLAPLCWPFILALLFSMMLEPLVRMVVTHMRRVKVPRGLVTLVAMALLFGILGVGLFALVSRLLHEVVSLARSTPVFVNWLSNTLIPQLKGLYQQYSDVLPVTAVDALNNALASLGKSAMEMAGQLSTAVTGFAVDAATSIPGILLSVVLTVMGTYYMTADRERIFAFFRRTFPIDVQRHSMLLKKNLFRSLFGQVKSQLSVSLIITSFLVLSFAIYGVRYGLTMGVLIGIADALPVIGAGLFLIPWAIVELIIGNYASAVFFAAVYLGTIMIRQIFEPRIVGANLGLYPLATMIAMFAGFQLFGFLGMLAGPIMLNLLKVVLEADDVAHGIIKSKPGARWIGKKGEERTEPAPETPAPTARDTAPASENAPETTEAEAAGAPDC